MDAGTATATDAGTATMDAGTATPMDAGTATTVDAGTTSTIDAGTASMTADPSEQLAPYPGLMEIAEGVHAEMVSGRPAI